MDPRKGRHIKVRFIGSPNKLRSVAVVSKFLTSLVARIGMRALHDPVCFSVPIQVARLGFECDEDEGGVTGIVVLSTSHIALHTWPEHSYAVLDVYSCRDFYETEVREMIKTTFNANEYTIKVNDLSEALAYPFELPVGKTLD